MAYNWQQDSGPTNLQMLSEGYSTRGIDEFHSNAYGGDLPEEGERYGMTRGQTVNATLSHSEEARRKAEALDTEAKESIKASSARNQTIKDVYSGLQMTQSLAEMMTSKKKDFEKKTKKFAGGVLTNPLTQRGMKSGIEYIFGETGEEAVGEEAGTLTEEAVQKDWAEEASEVLGEQIAGDTAGSAVDLATDAFGDLDLAALQEIDIAAAVAEEAAEGTSLAAEIAGPVVSTVAKIGAGLLGGKGAGEAVGGAVAGTGTAIATALIPGVGPWLAPITGAAASYGASQALGGGKGSAIPGGPRMRTGLGRKFIGTPSASQLLRGFG